MNSSIWLRLAVLTALICVASPTLAQTTRTWTGAVDNHWSVAGNWNPAGSPVDGDSLVFPANATNRSTDNDLAPGADFAQIAVTGSGYTLNGNGIELSDSFTGTYPQVNLPINVAGNAVTFLGNSTRLNGELSGTGPVLVTSDLELSGTHSFSGAMTVQSNLLLDDAHLPQATLNLEGFLYGNGSVGPVNWTNGWISPGLGQIDTSDLAASGGGALSIHIVGTIPGISHGHLKVAGSVDLGAFKWLSSTFSNSLVLTAGQELVLIDNDGSDPISGAFSNYPQGSVITHNGAELLVSYSGGDGNDFSLTCISAPRVWNGAVNGLWSEPGNWTPSGVPVAGDYLRFPDGAANRVSTNDLTAGTALSRIDVAGSGYEFSGNRIELTESWFDTWWNTQINLPIDVAGNSVTFDGSPTLSGELSGTGPVLISGNWQLSGIHSYSGTITVQGDLHLDSTDLSQATMDLQGDLRGAGILGPVEWTGGWISPGFGKIETDDLTASLWGGLSIQIEGTIPGVSHSQLQVAGAVELGANKSFMTNFDSSFVPIVGQELLLIDNDGSDPISGSFFNRPEGLIITHNGAELLLSYAGGDGNDLSLTCVSAPRVWNGAVNGLWSEPGNWTPSGVPVAGEDLRFPADAANRVMTNDLPPGIAISRVDVTSPGYAFNGNRIELTESWFAGWWSSQINLPIDVAGNSVTLSGYATMAGALSGTGPVLMSGSYSLSGSHGYSGTMTVQDHLQLDNADLSQASIVLAGYLSGSGAVGAVDWIAFGKISLGDEQIDTGNLSATGLGELTLQIEDNTPGVSHGKLRVAGSVELGTSKTLSTNFNSNFVPIVGQELVLIDNDGSDLIGGAFTNRPEGSVVIHNGAELQVSYSGGDGNDLSLTCISAPRVWSGTVSGLWSEPGNWTPSGVPESGDDLRFPNDAANRNTTNDLPAGTAFSRVEVVDLGYTFSGNRIELAESWITGWWSTQIDLPIDVAGNAVTFLGTLTLAGELSGSGPVLVSDYLTLTGTHGYGGTMTVQRQLRLDEADLSQATLVLQGSLIGGGSVGPVSWASSGNIYAQLERIATGDLTATDWGTLHIQSTGTIPGISHGQLRVVGNVELGLSKTLNLYVNGGFVPALGQELVLIDNNGSDAINGTFIGRPEGATVVLGNFSYQLSYVGGDGNDLSITSLDGRLPTTTSLVSNRNPAQTGQWVTLTATVAGGTQTPDGEVIFRDGSTELGTVSLDVGGTAIISTASLEPGSHSLIAEYLGGPNHGASVSAPLIQDIGEFHTLTYTTGPNGSLLGEISQQVFEGNDGSEISAVPDLGYRFVQWSDASLANPRIDTNVTENLSVEAQFGIDPDLVDLEVAKDDGLQAALDGQAVVYAITVANAGLVAANGAQLNDVLPVELIDGEWACIPAESNTACPQSPFDAGSGDLYAEIDLPVGGYLRYDLSARIQAGGGATVSNTASVAPPAGQGDLEPGNNSATDSTLIEPVGIFGTGFEANPVLLSVPAAAKAQREAAGGSQ